MILVIVAVILGINVKLIEFDFILRMVVKATQFDGIEKVELLGSQTQSGLVWICWELK